MDITTADLDTELPAGHPLLDLLRKVAEYRAVGFDPEIDPLIIDLEPLHVLQDMGMLLVHRESRGTWDAWGYEEWGNIWRVTERGLEELVVHGRER